MSDPREEADARRLREAAADEAADTPSKGFNLYLVYSLIALALAVAIGCALTIVFPFYHRR